MRNRENYRKYSGYTFKITDISAVNDPKVANLVSN